MILLFVETGIQHVDLDRPLDFQDADAGEAYQFLINADGSVAPRALGPDDMDGFFADDAEWTEGRTETTIVCTPIDGLEIFSRQWIPIPYHSTNPFWVRAFLEPTMGSTGQVYHVVLACDTHSRTERRDDNLGILRGSEIGYAFSVNPDLEAFWAHTEVRSLSHSAWRAWLRRTHPDANPSDPNAVSLSEGPAAALAKLWALVRYLAGRLPEIRFAKGSESEPIDAHLVLDLGNCRTCGIIVETPSNGGPFFAGLEMRSHDLPSRRNKDPFESHMQFVRSAVDGPAAADGGRFDGFSLIRLGDEALEAGAWGGVTGAVTGMSSPKRYLWDDSPRPTDWCFVADDVAQPPGPIEGTVLRYIDPERPFRRPEVALLTNPPSPRYSRKAGLVFVLLEILEQAFGQMNCVVHRRNMPIEGGESRRRIFRSLVLVHPSGMTPLERKELEQGARRAVDIWFDAYRDPIAFRRGETE
ncbi:MAG: virulence factor SrfB, partial [Planctomycetota bacterium]